MIHDTARRLLPAYADGECSPLRRFLLRRHYNHCPACLAQLEAQQAASAVLRTSLTVHRAPPGLASRIASALPREAPPPVRPQRRFAAFGYGGSALAGACAGVLLMLGLHSQPDTLGAEAVADHVRSLMADHLTDVPSSDQHTVKPWLSAHLELSPVVKDLAPEGFPLIGGRLDYLMGHRAAALVYRRARHTINLFAFAEDGPAATDPRLTVRDGFNIVRWRMGGLTYVAVSDVEAAQLLDFVQLIGAA